MPAAKRRARTKRAIADLERALGDDERPVLLHELLQLAKETQAALDALAARLDRLDDRPARVQRKPGERAYRAVHDPSRKARSQRAKVEIGKRVAELREAIGMSKVDMGRALGYDAPHMYSRLERGERGFRIEQLEVVARLTGGSIDYLARGVGPKMRPRR